MRIFCTISLIGLFVQISLAQLIINEACGKNTQIIANAQGDFTDWIELYNSGSGGVQLDDFFLSDDSTNLFQWQLPAQTLAPGQFILVFAEEDQPAANYFPFRITQNGEPLFLTDQSGLIVSRLNIPFHFVDHSFGHFNEQIDIGYLFDQPTPGFSNNTLGYKGYASAPEFFPEPMLISQPISVTVITAQAETIHFTSDGSEPTLSSPIVSGPLQTDWGKSFQARSFGDSLLPSAVIGASYLVKPNAPIPTIAIQVDPDSMFDPLLGMYSLGPNADSIPPFLGANYWEERELPGKFEYFSNSGIQAIEQTVGVQIHGGSGSRVLGQKPLRITARSKYGDKDLDLEFFSQRPAIDRFKRLILRNSGSDFCLSNFRDGFWHRLALQEELNVDVLAFEPAQVYLNGQYWGLMNIRERIDDDHLQNVFGADKDSVLIMEEENFSIRGDSTIFLALEQFIATNDLSISSNWSAVEALLDIESVKDYFALQLFAGNPDWPSNNLKYWKPSENDGKWRYLFFDLDATMNAFGWLPESTDPLDYLFVVKAGFMHTELFRKLNENAEFQRTFINRVADLMNTSFIPEKLYQNRDAIIERFGGERVDHFSRWCWDPANWPLHTFDRIPLFFDARQGVVRDAFQSWYGLDAQHEIKFEIFPPGSGSVKLNSLNLDSSLTGIYFEGNPIDLLAQAKPGAVFDRWEFSHSRNLSSEQDQIQVDPQAQETITAYFKTSNTGFSVFPNPTTDKIFLTVSAERASTGTVMITNSMGKLLRARERNVTAGVNGFILDVSGLPAGMYNLTYSDELTWRSSLFVKQ